MIYSAALIDELWEGVSTLPQFEKSILQLTNSLLAPLADRHHEI